MYKKQRPAVIWLTGLSGAGKSTISEHAKLKLLEMNIKVFTLDGDDLRQGLNKDLGFTRSDRSENIRRAAEVAALLYRSGYIVLCSFISPFNDDRAFAKSLFSKGDFLEVYIKCDIETCIKRDPKCLYEKAKKNNIKQFTGISSPYETPLNADLVINTQILNIDESSDMIINYVKNHLI